jgi:hypothetical protein
VKLQKNQGSLAGAAASLPLICETEPLTIQRMIVKLQNETRQFRRFRVQQVLVPQVHHVGRPLADAQEAADLRLNEWMNEWMDGWMNGCMYECMNVWMYERMNVWMYECMNVWMYGCMNGWIHEWMNEWMNGWIDERMDERKK